MRHMLVAVLLTVMENESQRKVRAASKQHTHPIHNLHVLNQIKLNFRYTQEQFYDSTTEIPL